MLTRRVRLLVGDANDFDVDKTVSLQADGVEDRSVQVAGEASDVEVLLAADKDDIKLLLISSDQDVTVETNSGSVADDTFAISAGVPMLWYEGCGMAQPLSADLTGLYISNAGETAANVEIKILLDTTPA